MTARIKTKIDAEELRQRLKYKSLQTRSDFSERFPRASKFLSEKGLPLGKLREHSTKLLQAGIISGTLLLSGPGQVKELPSPHEIIEKLKLGSIDKQQKSNQSKQILADSLNDSLPERARPLTRYEEKYLEQLIKNTTGIPIKAYLEGEHLNTNYGYIGIEQHLRRFPGDTLSNHGEGVHLKEGMAPGLGAWGYLSPNQEKMSKNLEDIEKWYAVVQTLYLPDWNTRQPYLKNWYRFRKVLIVNCENGNAVVASIADSGPAAWTGKQYGGSPEVMHELGGLKYKKGKVLLFFVDDPENKIALGPVDYNKVSLNLMSFK